MFTEGQLTAVLIRLVKVTAELTKIATQLQCEIDTLGLPTAVADPFYGTLSVGPASSDPELKTRQCYSCYQEDSRVECEHGESSADRKAIAMRLKGGVCVDCGFESDIQAAFDFHHLDSADKTASLSRLLADGDWEEVLAELEKCELTCARCHRIRHAKPKRN